MQLWDKGTYTDQLVIEFTSGKDRESDLKLAKYDVLGSIAHVIMLNKTGFLSDNDLLMLKDELKNIYSLIGKGEFVIEEGVEDVHSQIELMLTKTLGETGKKVHTGRSRNDQVLLDLKLFARDRIKEIVSQVDSLFSKLIRLSNDHKDKLLPGYTHMQVAMPSSFGLWFGAYAESLAEDLIILDSAFRLTNQNPLGSAAGFGSSFNIDRTMTTELLGFENMHVNVVNAQMNRGKMEKTIAFALGAIGSTLSRLSMDICIYSGQNFGFLSLPDILTTGSSIMPHKKNPDIFELIRARGNKLQALSSEMSLITVNLPSGYHRDFQILKENFIPAFDTLNEMLMLTGYVIEKIVINDNILENELYRYLFSVEEVNKLVLKGSSFRDAYREIADKIGNGTYEPDKNIYHTHAGSIGNLCNDLIISKMKQIKSSFEFKRIEAAFDRLLNS